MNNKFIKFTALILAISVLSACTFAGDPSSVFSGTPGFLQGLWHGILAPYTLIVRHFIDIKMYAINNSGTGYDLGFILGMFGAIPIGWLATLIAIAFYFLT